MLRPRISSLLSISLRAVALTILALLVAPQIYSQEDDVVRIDTDLVVLNVTVLDKDRQYVPGLKLSDFKVFEEGREVPIKLISSFGSARNHRFASVVLLDTSGSMESRLTWVVRRQFVS